MGIGENDQYSIFNLLIVIGDVQGTVAAVAEVPCMGWR
jgi:hypothetical protein